MFAKAIAIAENGFKHTGLWTLNPDIFQEHLFAPAVTTDIPESDPQLNEFVRPIGPATPRQNEENGGTEQPPKIIETVEVRNQEAFTKHQSCSFHFKT